MTRLEILFSAVAQIVVGLFFVLITIFQWVWWTLVRPPSVAAVFHVSMEALLFAAYAVMATGFGILHTQRVARMVDEQNGTDV